MYRVTETEGREHNSRLKKQSSVYAIQLDDEKGDLDPMRGETEADDDRVTFNRPDRHVAFDSNQKPREA